MSPNSHPSDTLVLGTAFGYSPDKVQVFVESLRRHYTGDVMLLVTSRDSADLIAYLAAHHMTPVYFDSPYWMFVHVQIARYVRYAELLRGLIGRYSRVLVTDVADVLFQAHPFADAPDGELSCFMEIAGRTIGQCAMNTSWVQQIFGDQTLQMLRDHEISCAGVTLGTLAATLDYVDRILHYAQPQVIAKLSPYRGHEQGIHNYLLRTGQLPQARLVPNGHHVFTVGMVPDDSIRTAPDGKILTADGLLCPIVHQYPYKEHLLSHIRAAYPPLPPPSPRFFTSAGTPLPAR